MILARDPASAYSSTTRASEYVRAGRSAIPKATTYRTANATPPMAPTRVVDLISSLLDAWLRRPTYVRAGGVSSVPGRVSLILRSRSAQPVGGGRRTFPRIACGEGD